MIDINNRIDSLPICIHQLSTETTHATARNRLTKTVDPAQYLKPIITLIEVCYKGIIFLPDPGSGRGHDQLLLCRVALARGELQMGHLASGDLQIGRLNRGYLERSFHRPVNVGELGQGR